VERQLWSLARPRLCLMQRLQRRGLGMLLLCLLLLHAVLRSAG
jgi:hypothetical protein